MRECSNLILFIVLSSIPAAEAAAGAQQPHPIYCRVQYWQQKRRREHSNLILFIVEFSTGSRSGGGSAATSSSSPSSSSSSPHSLSGLYSRSGNYKVWNYKIVIGGKHSCIYSFNQNMKHAVAERDNQSMGVVYEYAWIYY